MASDVLKHPGSCIDDAADRPQGFVIARDDGAGLAGVRCAGLTPVSLLVMGHAADGPMREIVYQNPFARPGDVAGWAFAVFAQVPRR